MHRRTRAPLSHYYYQRLLFFVVFLYFQCQLTLSDNCPILRSTVWALNHPILIYAAIAFAL